MCLLRNRLSIAGALLVAAMLSTHALAAPGVTTPNNQVLAAGSRYMTQLFEKHSEAVGSPMMRIDFSDEVQYRFVVNRLLASGNTPDNSPYLFQRVEQMRQQGLARKQAGGKGGEVMTQANPKKCGNIIEKTAAINGNRKYFDVNPMVSCFDGAEYTYADMYVYETDLNETTQTLLGSNAGEEYGGGRHFTDVHVNASIQMGLNHKAVFDSMVMVFDSSGEDFTTYALAKELASPPKLEITVEHPMELLNDANPIRTCLQRGVVAGNLDCDYATVVDTGTALNPFTWGGPNPTGVAGILLPHNNVWRGDRSKYWTPTNDQGLPTPFDPNKLYAGLRGNIKVDQSDCVITSFQPNTKALLVVKQAGGTCAKFTVDQELAAGNFMPSLTPGTNQVNFNLLGDFGQDCLSYLTDQQGSYWQDLELKLVFSAKIKCGPTGPEQLRYGVGRFGKIMDFRNSCLAEGTTVQMADGHEALIDNVKVGDKVVANTRGLALTVTSVSRGSESKPMVRITDDKGHQVMMTAKHPILAAGGHVLPAEQLKVGDSVLTQGGATTIRSVERVPFTGQVFNLALGTPQELANLGEKDKTLFANGFMVGDSDMQSALEVKLSAKPSSGDVLARLPKALHVDYKNDLARKAAQHK